MPRSGAGDRIIGMKGAEVAEEYERITGSMLPIAPAGSRVGGMAYGTGMTATHARSRTCHIGS